MKRKISAFFTSLLVMLPTLALADVAPPGGSPGCWYSSTDLHSIAGVALVSVAVGIVLYSRRP